MWLLLWEHQMSVYGLILFPEAEMKVGIILMLQMWELRHLKAKKLGQIQQQIRERRAEISLLTPKPGHLWPFQIVHTASLFLHGLFYARVILGQPITSSRWAMTVLLPKSSLQEEGATPRLWIILRDERQQARTLNKYTLARETPTLPK